MRRALVLMFVLLPLAAPASGCAWVSKTFGRAPEQRAEPTPEERRQAYVSEHPDLDEQVRAAITEGRLVEGMSGDEVRASIGRPASYGVMLPASPEQGDEEWLFEQVAFGTKTSFEANGPRSERILSGVRDTRVRFWEGKVVGVDDLGYETRDDIATRCEHGNGNACERLRRLDALAAAQPPPPAG